MMGLQNSNVFSPTLPSNPYGQLGQAEPTNNNSKGSSISLQNSSVENMHNRN